jgi:hypothetical protein
MLTIAVCDSCSAYQGGEGSDPVQVSYHAISEGDTWPTEFGPCHSLLPASFDCSAAVRATSPLHAAVESRLWIKVCCWSQRILGGP